MYRLSSISTLLAIIFIGCQGPFAFAQSANTAWPKDSNKGCSQSTKQKAMYGSMTFNPPFSQKELTHMSVVIEWNDLQFSPDNTGDKGGVYIAYTTGMKNGPGGYFGVQITSSRGQFLFSIWDSDRWSGKGDNKQPKPSSKLVWPLNLNRCKRNCQDCGLKHLRQWKKLGLTTGTKCVMKYPEMKVGDKYEVTLKRTDDKATINTMDHGKMPAAHARFGETDRDITGSIWVVTVKDLTENSSRNKEEFEVGKILFEGDGTGMNRLGTFDEMLGCNKCNAIHHKDTRYGPKVFDKDGIREPIKMRGKSKSGQSSCKGYDITGLKSEKSITFESGPFTKDSVFSVDSSKQDIW